MMRNPQRHVAVNGNDLFLATVVHELRDPLVPLRNLAQLLGSGNFDVTRIGQVSGIIDRQVSAMARLIDDLLDVSRLRLGKLPLRVGRAAMSDIVTRAIETVRPLIAARRHTLTVSVPLAPLYIDADATRLCQVLHNLIGNAAKYTDCGGKIHVQVQLDHGDVLVTVADNGLGIEPADIETIFEPWEQAGVATARSAGGLGVGLYIARSLVEAHGGTLRARSAGTGKGSELVIRLPYGSAVPAQERLQLLEGPVRSAHEAPVSLLVS